MKYIAYFDIPENSPQQRSISLAAVNVMSYIGDILNDIEPLEIISPCRTLAPKGFFRSKKIILDNGITLRLPFTFGVSSKIGRFLSIIFVQCWLFGVLLSCKKNETVIVYHSMALISPIRFFQRFKHFNLIFEIREVYSDVNSKFNKERELRYFDLADRYIFATQLLNEKINKHHKPFVVAPGAYKDEYRQNPEKWNDDKIHLVYAGNFDKTKGGAYITISLAEHLTSKYIIHLLGDCDENSLNEVHRLIEYQNSKNGAKVIYNGILRGDEYNLFLQKCDIGLSTQNPDGAFNDSSFPSKILTYLGNGLEVVSADIPAVTTSPIGKYVHYYRSSSPESIAKTILSIKRNDTPKDIFKSLDSQLRSDIKAFFN